MRKKIFVGAIISLVLLLAVFASAFYFTGGKQLVTLYTTYLSQDIPDKKYSYQDFTDRGPREVLSGYYAGSIGNNIYVWTYSGLKRFIHKPTTSVYYYMDTCGAIAGIAARKERGEEVRGDIVYSESMTFLLSEWRAQMHRGDYLWVKRVGEGSEDDIIDKVWGNNNPHYPYGGITLSQCRRI